MKSKNLGPLKGNWNAFVENGGQGRREDGRGDEARRTRGLDLRRREQLKGHRVCLAAKKLLRMSVTPIGETRVRGLQGHSLPHSFYCISSYHAY